MNYIKLTIALIVIAWSWGSGSGFKFTMPMNNGNSPLQASLQHDPAAASPYHIQVTLYNPSSTQSIAVLNYETAIEGLRAPNIFSVNEARTQQPVQYDGMIAKRVPPTADSFTILAPLESKTVEIDLTEAYKFAQGLNYEVELHNTMKMLVGVANKEELSSVLATAKSTSSSIHKMEIQSVQSNKITIASQTNTELKWQVQANTMQKSSQQRQSKGNALQAVGSYTTSGCSQTQINEFPTVLNNVESGLTMANSYFSGSCYDNQYIQWFGTYTSTRYNLVKTHYTNIMNKLTGGGFGLVCNGGSCQQSTFAYVFPSDSTYQIYVCNAYFSASSSLQTDSRPGTIVHEFSHFTPLGGTSDHQYGQSNCRTLATSNPDQAVMNADSHEYFVEQQPTTGASFCGNNFTTSGTVQAASSSSTLSSLLLCMLIAASFALFF